MAAVAGLQRPKAWPGRPRRRSGCAGSPLNCTRCLPRCWTGLVSGRARTVDLGCGPSGFIELLCERVGPARGVVGVDLDAPLASRARELTREKGLANAEIMQADARRTGLPGSSLDLVHARTLLVNIPDPGAVVAEMARLAKPGGWVSAGAPAAESR
jgi:ubiquinone/menaquinone biosynthesis C-methylase UbiE